MSFRIEIDAERCKGCALCTTACPRKLLTLDEQGREFPVAVILNKESCVACAMCASICPDIAIKVFSRTRNCYAMQRSRSFAVVEKKVSSGN